MSKNVIDSKEEMVFKVLDGTPAPKWGAIEVPRWKVGCESMKFLALIRWHENMNDKIAAEKFYEEMGGDEGMFSLPEGVTILESGKVFGRYVFAMFYEAPDEETAMKVLGEFDAYAKIDRFLTGPCPWCENTK